MYIVVCLLLEGDVAVKILMRSGIFEYLVLMFYNSHKIITCIINYV